ncbi:MAG: cytochrome bc1 complex diheme cytochrome c subunit [Pseudonocardia sp.]
MTAKSVRRPARTKLRRRLAAGVALGVALLASGLLYTVLTPQPQTAAAQSTDAALIAQGEKLFNDHCISCHGSNLQGVQDRGPSLIGVGDAAVYFQVSTGKMPLARQEAEALRKPPLPEFDLDTEEGRKNLDALGAYVQANGGGPTRPDASPEQLTGDNPARGGELFRLNCASCHNFTGRGGALSSGKAAPPLDEASELQIYTAMLTGPENMPKFSDRQITPEEKKDIIAYLESVSDGKNNPGGNALGGIGPVSEGLVAWLVGMGALIACTLWLGAKA